MADITVEIIEQVANVIEVVPSTAIIVETPATQGVPGPIGPTGITGATWLNDAGAPSVAIGRVGDYYLNSDNGDIYYKTGDTTWTFTMNVASSHARLHAMTSVDDHSAGNYKLFYSDGSGHIQELAHGANGYYLKSNGITSAPTWEAFVDYVSEAEFTVYSGTLQTQINSKPTTFIGLTDTPSGYSVGLFAKSTASGIVWEAAAPDLDYVLETEFTTYSGTIQTQINAKPTTFLGLTDTPDVYSNGLFAKSTTSGIEWSAASSTFIELTDTPSSYDDGKYARSTTSGIVWATVSGGAGVSPLTTKGDIYVYGTSDTKLPVGNDGEVIVADSSETLGLKWATVSGGGGAATFIELTDTPDVYSDGQYAKSTTTGVIWADVPAAGVSEAELITCSGILNDKITTTSGVLQTNINAKLANIVEDTTPQLGGDLDANTHAIVAADHGTATTAQVVNVVYGTGAAPAANTTTEGTLFIKYTA